MAIAATAYVSNSLRQCYFVHLLGFREHILEIQSTKKQEQTFFPGLSKLSKLLKTQLDRKR